jgi:hypothetical protein
MIFIQSNTPDTLHNSHFHPIDIPRRKTDEPKLRTGKNTILRKDTYEKPATGR